MSTENQPLIRVVELVKNFPVRLGAYGEKKALVHAVNHVSFEIMQGETLGLVGESGCGKSTTGFSVLQLHRPTSGNCFFRDTDLTLLNEEQLRPCRKKVQIIFQDPYSSLDPRMTVEKIVTEPLLAGHRPPRAERRRIAAGLLEKVGLRAVDLDKYPHEFSGGQRQRIGIARALCVRPALIVADEPVSALDVSIQAQVINLLEDLQHDFNLTYIFVAHDLSVVEHISDRVAVMYLGKMVELTTRVELFRNPLHPYTQALMSAIPIPDPKIRRERIILKGDVPSPLRPPTGCRFHPRCPVAMDHCKVQEPPFKEVSPEHSTACWRVG